MQDRSFNKMVNYLLHHIEAYESKISVQEAGYQVAIQIMEALERELATLKQSSAALANTAVARTLGTRHGKHQQQQQQQIAATRTRDNSKPSAGPNKYCWRYGYNYVHTGIQCRLMRKGRELYTNDMRNATYPYAVLGAAGNMAAQVSKRASK